MNYPAHYERLIARARDRVLTGYCERHHVVPKCMGGGNEKANLVELTPEEHYVAHQLLCKIHPRSLGLATGAVRMSKKCTGNKAFGWLRRRSSELRKGRTHSKETRLKISLSKRGSKMPPRTDEHRAKLSTARKRQLWSPETRAKMSKSKSGNTYRRGKSASDETRAKLRIANSARVTSDATKAKLSAMFKGRVFSPEWREKISAAQKGKKKSQEQVANWKQSMQKRWSVGDFPSRGSNGKFQK